MYSHEFLSRHRGVSLKISLLNANGHVLETTRLRLGLGVESVRLGLGLGVADSLVLGTVDSLVDPSVPPILPVAGATALKG